MNERGLILVNTGDGKGKTTAAVGVAIRALGQNQKVAFFQFMKTQETGESKMLEEYAAQHPSRLRYGRVGTGLVFGGPSAEDRAAAMEALGEARKLAAADYDLVVLDEICVAVSLGLIPVQDAVDLVKSKREGVNLILTGRGCPPEIIELADTVTEMKPLKHAYEKGVSARRGIEF